MSGFIEFCVELKSVSEGAAATAADAVDGAAPQQSSGQEGGKRNGRGGRRGMLQRQSSVVCSRVHTLSTINYVDNGERDTVGSKSLQTVLFINIGIKYWQIHPFVFQNCVAALD